MADFNNIPVGLNITTQIPLDVKTISLTESNLASLGIDNNKAFTYYDGLKVYCLDTRKTYEWRERKVGDTNGLITLDFTYPANTVAFGITYSNKIFNFFEVPFVLSSDIKEIVSPNNTVNITETPTQIQLTVTPSNGSETKIINGLQTTVTGTGTTLDPYKIDGKLYQAGSGITITGSGTSLNPYIIAIDHSNNTPQWLRGDTKEIVCDRLYVDDNFTSSGLGINEREGWAIMNGNNGTPNDNGKVTIAYGSSYTTLEETGGSKNTVLPEHFHYMFASEINTGGPTVGIVTGDRSVARSTSGKDEFNYEMGYAGLPNVDAATLGRTSTEGQVVEDNNMQPYIVRLRIMKI